MAGENINNSNVKYWLMIVGELLLFLFITGTMSRYNSNKVDVLENNIIAYKDSLKTVSLKNGELLSYKQILILDNEAMRQELGITKKEVKDLEKQLDSKIAQINRLTSKIELKDTVYMKSDSVYMVSDDISTKIFKWSDNWTSLTANITGKSIYESNLSLYDISMKVPIELGVTNDYKIWAKSTNPNVIIEDITSVTLYGSKIYPKPKRLHHGISLGFGINYGMLSKQLDFGPSLIYGLTYSF